MKLQRSSDEILVKFNLIFFIGNFLIESPLRQRSEIFNNFNNKKFESRLAVHKPRKKIDLSH